MTLTFIWLYYAIINSCCLCSTIMHGCHFNCVTLNKKKWLHCNHLWLQEALYRLQRILLGKSKQQKGEHRFEG